MKSIGRADPTHGFDPSMTCMCRCGRSTWQRTVFVRDTLTGTTARVSLTSAGKQSNDHSFSGDVSVDGTMATFQTEASNVVLGDQPYTFDVFLRRP